MENSLSFEVLVPQLKRRMNTFQRALESILLLLHRSEPEADLSIKIGNISQPIYFEKIKAEVDQLVKEEIVVYPQNQNYNDDIINTKKKNYENYFSDSIDSHNISISDIDLFARIPI